MPKQTYIPSYVAQTHHVQINGLSLEMLHWPRDSRPKLLFLHGWMDCAATFQQVIDALPSVYDIYALSWRGFGASQWQTSGYYERMVMLQDLHQCLDHINPNAPTHVVGHSMGSMLATQYAGLFPNRISSLTMAEGFGMPLIDDEEALIQRMQRFITTPKPEPSYALKSHQNLAEKLQKRNPNMAPEFAYFMAEALTHTTGGQLHYLADPKHHLPQAHPYDWHRIEPIWQRLHMPVLWLQGEALPHNHYLLRLQDALKSRQHLLPNLHDAITLQGSGHMLQWEAPQAFAAALDNFLRQIDA